ncbi:MAG: hypothetical protein IPN01_37770 [Deltaproteobacteria bacterium]|nr:hypothetical protein [Deltaproteobacteria bacterium]MBK9371982.1 hypothetical protein [Deltaproteobacteria bacterium]
MTERHHPSRERWDDLIQGVERALSELGITQFDTRAAVMDGVREALESAIEVLDDHPFPTGTRREPEITVLPGRRGEVSSRRGAVPGLRLAQPGETVEPELDADESPPPKVRVVRVHPDRSPSHQDHAASPTSAHAHSPHDGLDGLDDVPSGPAPTSLSAVGLVRLSLETRYAQTLYRGERSRPYRVSCSAGRFNVIVDGFCLDPLTAGQSVDVEGRTLRLEGNEPATGAYVRLDER